MSRLKDFIEYINGDVYEGDLDVDVESEYTPPHEYHDQQPQQYEYEVVFFGSPFAEYEYADEALNKMAAAGWRFVESNGDDKLIFEREIQEVDGE